MRKNNNQRAPAIGVSGTGNPNQQGMINIANRIESVRAREGFSGNANLYCETLATLAMIHSRIIYDQRRQVELEFQEAAAEHYVQQREADEIFYNWVDDI